MARPGEMFGAVSPIADMHQQIAVDTAQTVTLASNCNAVILSARTQSVAVTFDDSTPVAATNGTVIVAGAQPVLIPLGYHCNANHTLKAIGLSAGGFLDVIQVS